MPSEQIADYVCILKAAKEAGYNPESLRRACREGRLAGHKIHGEWFVSSASIAELKEKKS